MFELGWLDDEGNSQGSSQAMVDPTHGRCLDSLEASRSRAKSINVRLRESDDGGGKRNDGREFLSEAEEGGGKMALCGVVWCGGSGDESGGCGGGTQAGSAKSRRPGR